MSDSFDYVSIEPDPVFAAASSLQSDLWMEPLEAPQVELIGDWVAARAIQQLLDAIVDMKYAMAEQGKILGHCATVAALQVCAADTTYMILNDLVPHGGGSD